MTESRLDLSAAGPASKRRRLASPAGREEPLALLQERARLGCLCPLPAAQLPALTDQLAAPDSGRQLVALSALQLLQEAALQQLRQGSMCRQLQAAVCLTQRQADGPLRQALLELLAAERALLSCGAGRCLALAALLLPAGGAQRLLEALVSAVLESERPLEVSHALNTLQRLIEQHEPPESASGGRPLPAGCSAVSVLPDPEALSEIKCTITTLLESRWVPVTQRFCRLLTRPEHETEVLAFLRLWTTIISVKNNLSIVETKAFYGRLEGLMGSLGGDTSPHVWRAVLDLYSEVLCYGSTIALQDCVAEEPASLAHALLRQTRAGRLLELVPYERGVVSFAGDGGGEPAGDRPLMQRTVLLLLKALAVTVKETRSESSSEASGRSAGGSGSEEQDMAIIARTLRDVVRRLDGWVKARLPFHPETPLAEWAVVLLCDQEDSLVEAMVCLLDLCAGLAERPRVQPDFERAIDAHRSFVQFLGTVRRDHDLLLDFLISNETYFLLYLLRYLKFVRRHWARFTGACGAKLPEVMAVLIGLRVSLQRLVARDLFPYNVAPILKLLERCEQLYEHNPAAG